MQKMFSDRVGDAVHSLLSRLDSGIHTASSAFHTKKKVPLFLLAVISIMFVVSFIQIHPVKATSSEQFQFYIKDEQTGYSLSADVNVTAYAKVGNYTSFNVTSGGLLWNATNDILYFSFDLGNGVHREYWLLDGETAGTINIYGGNYTYGLSGSSYTLQFYDLAGILVNYPFVEVVSGASGAGEYLRLVERRKLDTSTKVSAWAIHGKSYTIKVLSNITDYIWGSLLFADVNPIPLTIAGLNFPSSIILAYQYNRVYAERYNNYSTIKVSYEDTLGDLANVTISIKFDNGTEAEGAATSYNNTVSFVYLFLTAEYNESYCVRVVITHARYGVMTYVSHLFHGDYNVSPWNFPLGSIPNMNTADIIPMITITACFLIFSAKNAYVAGFLGIAISIFMGVWGWVSIPAISILAAFIVIVLLGLVYGKRRVWY